MSDTLYQELIKGLFEKTTDAYEKLSAKFDLVVQGHTNLVDRISAIEAKLNSLDMKSAEERLRTIESKLSGNEERMKGLEGRLIEVESRPQKTNSWVNTVLCGLSIVINILLLLMFHK
jgi:hypothetical protein